MKIGHLDNSAKLAGNAAADARKPAPGSTGREAEASSKVELSPAADADFDAEKVARIAQGDPRRPLRGRRRGDRRRPHHAHPRTAGRQAAMSPDDRRALEGAFGAIEHRPAALVHALREHDATAIESEARQLQRALAAAVRCFAQAARQPGGVPPAPRQRLAQAGGQVAAQRECLARATAALDRAIDILVTAPQRAAAYAPQGVLRHAPRTGFVGA